MAGLAEALRRLNEHLANGETGAATCRYCPVCQLVHAVRETSPEVRQHLGDAAGSLLEAATGLLADRQAAGQEPAGGAAARPGSHAARRPAPPHDGSEARTTGVERIDVSDGDWGDWGDRGD